MAARSPQFIVMRLQGSLNYYNIGEVEEIDKPGMINSNQCSTVYQNNTQLSLSRSFDYR